jgi:hypothetical protein
MPRGARNEVMGIVPLTAVAVLVVGSVGGEQLSGGFQAAWTERILDGGKQRVLCAGDRLSRFPDLRDRPVPAGHLVAVAHAP